MMTKQATNSKPNWAWQSTRDMLLPSGNTARIRSIGFDYLITHEMLPDSLVNEAARAINFDEKDISERVWTLDELRDQIALVNGIMKACFVYPVIVEHEDEVDESAGRITVEMIEFFDKQYLMNMLYAPLAALRPFRTEQNADVGDVPITENNESGGE